MIAGVIAMIVISNYQYSFTLFTPGMKQHFAGVPYAQIAAIFSLFILFETWPMPVSGYFVDKFGIRKLMIIGSVGILVGWLLGGTIAKSVFDLYIYYGVIAGTGAGIIYISCVANAVKWFPDRRGLAAGLTAAGFGGGAATYHHAHRLHHRVPGLGEYYGHLGNCSGNNCLHYGPDITSSADQVGSL